MNQTIIMGIQVGNRTEDASDVQKLLTEYGCIIKTRLGLHEATNMCSSKGLIILEFVRGKEEEIKSLEEKLQSIQGLIIKKMEF